MNPENDQTPPPPYTGRGLSTMCHTLGRVKLTCKSGGGWNGTRVISLHNSLPQYGYKHGGLVAGGNGPGVPALLEVGRKLALGTSVRAR